MKKAIFSAGLRVPFGRSGKGAYAEIRPDDLMISLVDEHKQRFSPNYSPLPNDFLLGCAYPHGEQGFNLARMVMLGAGLDLPASTMTRLCGSSLEAVATAAARVRSGWSTKILVGGVESLSRVQRRGEDFVESQLINSRSKYAYIQMGETAERVFDRFQISRVEQEEFAARSHEMADQAYAAGFYQGQIVDSVLSRDEGIRVPVDREKMRSLVPSFRKGGTVTAATSSPLSDGACLGFLFAEEEFECSGLSDGLEILDIEWSHVQPELMGLGPIPAVAGLLRRNSLGTDDIDAFEMNEAFAVQSLACIRELGIPLEKVNTKGGAIAIGHPLGASGLRLLITLQARLFEIAKANALGIATLCIGGGQGMAVLCRYTRA